MNLLHRQPTNSGLLSNKWYNIHTWIGIYKSTFCVHRWGCIGNCESELMTRNGKVIWNEIFNLQDRKIEMWVYVECLYHVRFNSCAYNQQDSGSLVLYPFYYILYTVIKWKG